MNVVRIDDGRAVEIWANVSKNELCYRRHPGESEPRPIFHADFINSIVETENEVLPGDHFDGVKFISQKVSLNQIKAGLKAEVDREAERERQRYITGGAGQALIYDAKATEVAKWIAAGRPAVVEADAYPFAGDRAARLGIAIAQVLGEWEQRIAIWRMVGRAIEIVRENAKESIDAVQNEADARAVLAAVSWPA